jgi:hypothetical protein
VQAVQIGSDSISVREGHTSSEVTHFTTKVVSRFAGTIVSQSPDTIDITLVSDDNYAYDQKIIKAALVAIRKSFSIELKLTEIRSIDSMPASDWIIWLSDKNIPEVASKVLSIKPPFTNQQELFFHVKSNYWILTQRVNEEVALQENLTLKLASLLISRKKSESKANLEDRRMISDSIAWAAVQTDNKNIEAAVVSEPNPYLIVLLLILLFIERVVAYKRNQ